MGTVFLSKYINANDLGWADVQVRLGSGLHGVFVLVPRTYLSGGLR